MKRADARLVLRHGTQGATFVARERFCRLLRSLRKRRPSGDEHVLVAISLPSSSKPRHFDGSELDATLASHARRKTSHMSNRLYVGNLSFRTDETALRNAFSQFGEIVEIKIVLDRETGQSRGFGFVSMADANGARNAIAKMDGTMVDGRALRVNEAEERQQGGRSGGGGGGGGGGSRRSW
jgi:cold-inducible RNA-binding protein